MLDLVKSIKIDVNSSEDLYKAYMIIHLLNHIVYHRNMFEMDQVFFHLNNKISIFIYFLIVLMNERKLFDKIDFLCYLIYKNSIFFEIFHVYEL